MGSNPTLLIFAFCPLFLGANITYLRHSSILPRNSVEGPVEDKLFLAGVVPQSPTSSAFPPLLALLVMRDVGKASLAEPHTKLYSGRTLE